MNRDLRRLLDASNGVLRRADAVAVLPQHVVDQAVESRRLRPVARGVYVDGAVDQVPREMELRIALAHAGGAAALSHVTALEVWGLPVPGHGPVHLTVAPTVRLRGTATIRVHRHDGFEPEIPHAVVRGGHLVTRLEPSIVNSWPMLPREHKRAPAIRAVAERLTTPERLSAALGERPRLGGRRILDDLIGKLKAGCRSELEIWGHDHVFRGIPGLRWQVPVRLTHRTVYLDLFHPETRTNFELDGARYHTDRERDLRRDAELFAKGITVVRFTHDRLVHSAGDVRGEVTAILGVRSVAAA